MQLWRRTLYTIAYVVILGIPATALGYIVREELFQQALIIPVLACLFTGGVFDIWAVRQGPRDKFFVWEYNSKSILGFKFLGMPIEDVVLFFILTPVFVITVWEASKKFVVLHGDAMGYVTILGILSLALSYYVVYRHAVRSKY